MLNHCEERMNPGKAGNRQSPDVEQVRGGSDSVERPAPHQEPIREKTLDETLAESFPTSDPPSTIPDPVAGHVRNDSQAEFDALIESLPAGSWAVISENDMRVLGTGATREEAVQNAGHDDSQGIRVTRVPQDPDAPEQAA
jgi:hypothetical protein